jgi:hypothetical protein
VPHCKSYVSVKRSSRRSSAISETGSVYRRYDFAAISIGCPCCGAHRCRAKTGHGSWHIDCWLHAYRKKKVGEKLRRD